MTDTELKPGDRVLVEAVVLRGWSPSGGRVPLLAAQPSQEHHTAPMLQTAEVRWHRDDRAALIAERDRLAAELAQAKREADLMRTANDAYWRAQKVLDEVLGPNDEDGSGGGLAAEIALLAEQRDEARAQVAAMRAVVEAADLTAVPMRAMLLELKRRGDAEVYYADLGAEISMGASALIEKLPGSMLDDPPEVDAWRSGQTAPETAPEARVRPRDAADGLGEGQGSTGGVEGGTAVCSADGNDPCPRGTPNCPPDCATTRASSIEVIDGPMIYPGCTCPWKNGYPRHHDLGHHLLCPFLRQPHATDDDCGPNGHIDREDDEEADRG